MTYKSLLLVGTFSQFFVFCFAQPANFVITTSQVPVCTDAQNNAIRFIKRATQGVSAKDPVGHRIGFWPGHVWWPVDGLKHTLCGVLHDFKYYDPAGSGAEADWNNYIIPTTDFAFILDDVIPLTTDHNVWHNCNGSNNCLEAEITPDEDFYQNPWFPKTGDDPRSPREGRMVCVYGPWIMDDLHGYRPEIHPSEMYWWKEGENGPYLLFLLQDDSNRFDRVTDFFAGASDHDWWHPWGENPRTGEFRIPFELNTNGDPLIFTINSLREKNVVTGEDEQASADADDGTLHTLEYNGRSLVYVNEKQTKDSDIGVRFEEICRNESNNRLKGYVTITAKIGRNDRGGEGFYALRIDQQQVATVRKKVSVEIQRVRKFPVAILNGRPNLVSFNANGLVKTVSLPTGGGAATINVNQTLSFGNEFAGNRLTILAQARIGTTSLSDARIVFTETQNFGHGNTRTLTMSRRMCVTPGPNCEETLVAIADVTYRINVEDRFRLPEPPEHPDLPTDPPVIITAKIIESSIKTTRAGARQRLTADVEILTNSNIPQPSNSTVISTVQHKAGNLARNLAFSAVTVEKGGTERRVVARDITLDTSVRSSILVKMASGKTHAVSVPAFGLKPVITNESTDILPGKTIVYSNPRITLQKVNSWQYEIIPVYAPVRDGEVAGEDDSPIAEKLNEVIDEARKTKRTGELNAFFGSEGAFTISWVFKAVNLKSRQPVQVAKDQNAPASAVRFVLSPGIIPNERITVTFPDQDGVIELMATATLRDAFGLVGKYDKRMWSYVALKGQDESKLIVDLVSLMAAATGLRAEKLMTVTQVNDEFNADPVVLRRRAILGQLIRKTVNDKLVTIEEVEAIVKYTNTIANGFR